MADDFGVSRVFIKAVYKISDTDLQISENETRYIQQEELSLHTPENFRQYLAVGVGAAAVFITKWRLEESCSIIARWIGQSSVQYETYMPIKSADKIQKLSNYLENELKAYFTNIESTLKSTDEDELFHRIADLSRVRLESFKMCDLKTLQELLNGSPTSSELVSSNFGYEENSTDKETSDNAAATSIVETFGAQFRQENECITIEKRELSASGMNELFYINLAKPENLDSTKYAFMWRSDDGNEHEKMSLRFKNSAKSIILSCRCGHQYDFEFFQKNAGRKTSLRKRTIHTVPEPATNLTTAWDGKELSVRWGSANGASTYEFSVFESINGETVCEKICDYNEWSWTPQEGLNHDGTFTIQVISSNNAGRGKPTTERINIETIFRNVEVRRCRERGVNITFQNAESNGLEAYEVLAIPRIGKIRKWIFPKQGRPNEMETLNVKYLRRTVDYRFTLRSLYSDGSIGCSYTLHQPMAEVNDDASSAVNIAMQYAPNSKGASLKIIDSSITNQIAIVQVTETCESIPMPVRNLRADTDKTDDCGEKQLVVIRWEDPWPSDKEAYEIKKFIVNITGGQTITDSLCPEENNTKYQKKYLLTCGPKYYIIVAVVYWDVDADCLIKQESHELKVITAPEPVKNITSKWNANLLELHWDVSKGASFYEIRVISGDDNNTILCRKRSSSDTFKWERPEYNMDLIFKVNISSGNEHGNSCTTEQLIPLDKSLRNIKIKNEDEAPEPASLDSDKRQANLDVKVEVESHCFKRGKGVFRGTFTSNAKSSDSNLPNDRVAVKIVTESERGKRAIARNGHEKKKMEMRMSREAKHLSELTNHPNIVRYIYSFERSPGNYWIVMELCDEHTLEDRIKEDRKEFRDSEYCRAVLLHITQGLQYIHSKKICHRDMKPSNILFSIDGKVVKISDFGVAKRVDPDLSNTESSGTDAYRAPETYEYEDEVKKSFPEDVKPSRLIDERTDVFSLGLIYYFVLSRGKHPFGKGARTQSANIMKKKKAVVEGLVGPRANLAKELIIEMLKIAKYERPYVTEILKNPYFWSSDQMLRFYLRVADHLKSCQTLKQGVRMTKKQEQLINEEKVLSNSKVDCTDSFNTRLRNEFYTYQDEKDLSKMYKEVNEFLDYKEEVNSVGKMREFTTFFFKKLHLEEEIEDEEVKRDDEASSGENMEQLDSEIEKVDLVSKINKLTLRRHPDQKEKCIDIKNQLESEKIDLKGAKTIWDDLKKVYHQEIQGEDRNWKDCLRAELALHKESHECAHENFVKNCTNCKENITDLVNFIRNKLAHFYEDVEKKSLWPTTQECIMNFVAVAIPELLPHLYKVMKHEMKEYIEDSKQKDSSFFLPDV